MTTYDKLLNGRGLETVLRKLKTEIEIPREVFVGRYNVSSRDSSLEGCTYSEIAEAIVGRKVVVLYPVDTSEVNSIFYAYRPDTGAKSASVLFSTFPKIEGATVIAETLTVTSNSVVYEQTSTEKKIYTIDGQFSFEDPTEINTGFPQNIIQDVEAGKDVVISGTLSMIDEGDQPGPPQSVNPIAKSSTQEYGNVKYVAQYVTKESKDGVTRYYFDAFDVVERYSTSSSNRQPVALQFIVQSDKNNAVTCWAYELIDGIEFNALANSVLYREEVEPILDTGTPIAYIAGTTIYAPVSEEGIQSETDPVFSASPAASITATDISRWNAITTSITSTLDSRYVNITGDTMTGPLEVESDDGYGMTMKSILEHDKLSFWHGYALETPAATLSIGVNGWYSGIVLGVTDSTGATGTVGISGVATPSEEYDAANKIYVDDTVYTAVDDAMSAVTTMLSTYVSKSAVISTGPTNGTAIANIGGVTIYAPVAEGGVTVERDPVFTEWATGAGIAAYTITASDVSRWNAITTSIVNPVNADWNATTGLSSILNKPTIPTADSFTSTYDSRYALASHTHDYSKVTVSQTQTSGTEIGKITVNSNGSNTTTTLYAPTVNLSTYATKSYAEGLTATLVTAAVTNGLAKTSDLTSYVAKSDVIPATGITGTAIATVGGKTIYAPVSEEGIQSETDPVFGASAAAGITTGDIASWNAKSSITPVNADWNATTGLSTILNKPAIPTAASFTATYDSRYSLATHTHSQYLTSSDISNFITSSDIPVTDVKVSTDGTNYTSVVTNKVANINLNGYATIGMISGFANISDIPYITAEGSGTQLIATINQGGSTYGIYAPAGFSGDYEDLTNKPTLLDSGVLYADITGTTSLTSNVTYANIVAATPTKAVMLRRNGDIYQLSKAASSGLEFRVIKPLEIDEIVMTSSTITYNSYLTNVSGTTLTINE